MKEIWKDIKGYEGKYQVSNFGRVKSLYQEYMGGWRKQQLIVRPETILKSPCNSDGYPLVGLSKNNKRKSFKVHRLVAQEFIPNLYNLPEINHKNGNKNDNSINNLEWCTPQENVIHGINILGNRRAYGIRQHLAKLNDDLVKKIKMEFNEGKTPYELSPIYNVNARTLYRIKNNETWKHVII